MQAIYKKLNTKVKDKLKNCKLLALDFDGTLTDNKVYVSQDEIESVRADRGDGLGLEFLRKYAEIEVIILSRETNPVTAARAKKLKIPCTHGINDKLSNFKKEIEHHKLTPEQVCFIGNDLNDIECIKLAGLGVAVADSYQQILDVADYITTKNGGEGAVREICELIMYSKKVHPCPED
jgi:YrbI family 3-deoxy-D-manno-octulosonate 8-phosphate phosphatase